MSQTSKTEDTIDLKELFFSLIAQWKLIVLCILISLVCALIYLRVTPNTYSVDALVQVEDTKSAASAALLGELSKMVDQKSPAQAEIEVLTSRMVLGQVINNLNLDITIKNHDDTFFNRLLSQYKQNIDYKKDAVTFSNK
ncbi:Wzz/FepE/Etk N-terminal domain-containing protein, partial [Acinetobacter baumannii]|nr:Wzz/FepE/Etk N-terminal domain-containing protein [Acinetobacter baumannii]